MSKVVRSSKYRHVFGTAAKPEECYNNIKLSKNGTLPVPFAFFQLLTSAAF